MCFYYAWKVILTLLTIFLVWYKMKGLFILFLVLGFSKRERKPEKVNNQFTFFKLLFLDLHQREFFFASNFPHEWYNNWTYTELLMQRVYFGHFFDDGEKVLFLNVFANFTSVSKCQCPRQTVFTRLWDMGGQGSGPQEGVSWKISQGSENFLGGLVKKLWYL